MAAIDIPAGLELRALREGFQVSARPVRESAVDEGDAKRRPIAGASTPMTASFILTREVYRSLFLPFYDDTLGQGAFWFNWVHPITGAAIEAKFAGETAFTVEPRPGGRVQINAQLRIR